MDLIRSGFGNYERFGLLPLILALLQIGDVLTTNQALAKSGVYEANPIMAASQAHLGSAWWLPKLALVAFAFYVAPRIKRRWPFVFIVGLYVLIVGSNWALT